MISFVTECARDSSCIFFFSLNVAADIFRMTRKNNNRHPHILNQRNIFLIMGIGNDIIQGVNGIKTGASQPNVL